MGAIAQTIHEGGGKVIGVIPEALKKIERPGMFFRPFSGLHDSVVTYVTEPSLRIASGVGCGSV
jgi:predicted Rossmann-fold nucleotide-binding protein